MPDIPRPPGDAFESEDEQRPGEDPTSPENSKPGSNKPRSQPEEIGEESRRYPAAEILAGADSTEILERLMDGDPLGIRERCAERIRSQCYLLFFDRLYLRTMARVAHDGLQYKGESPFEEWMKKRIDESSREIMEEELEDERAEVPISDPEESHYAFVSELLGISPGLTRRGCIRFNQLEFAARQAFFALCVDGMSFNRYIAEGNGPPQRAKSLLKLAFEAFTSTLDEPEFGRGDVLGEDWEELP